MKINLDVYSLSNPLRSSLFPERVEKVILPAVNGEISILKDHIDLFVALETGIVKYQINNNWVSLVILSGFAIIANNVAKLYVLEVQEVEKNNISDNKSALPLICNDLKSTSSFKERLRLTNEIKRLNAHIKLAEQIT